MLDHVTEISPGYADSVAASSTSPAELAESVIAGIRAERFHILPHPEGASFPATKATEPERWLAAMRQLQDPLGASPPPNRVSIQPQ